jgi:hypothetical protein
VGLTSTTTTSLQASIKRILKAFAKADTPDLAQFVSGVNAPTQGSIDDGDYGDPFKSSKPDFVQKDNAGWV